MIRKALLVGAVSLVAVIVFFSLLEGLASTALVVRELLSTKPIAERSHTTYDADLGWINLPDLFIPDMYGPGRYLRTNAQRLRGNAAVPARNTEGKVRLICSGDSFTFGYGVDNDHTWCQRLVALNPRLETINMGQGGYGVDQAYLWYKRDGVVLDHDLHLFTFVTTDFERMLSDRFLGYGKPTLDVRHGALVVQNVPVPPPSWYRLWLNRNAPTLQHLSSVKLLQGLGPTNGAPVGGRSREEVSEWIQQVVDAVFADLQRLNGSKHSALVLVLLPTRQDYVGSASEFWRDFLRTEAADRHVAFIDVIEELRKLPPQEIEPLFIADGALDYVGAAGHYSEAGNAYVADVLYRRLLAIPEAAVKLTGAGSRNGTANALQ